MLLRKNNAEGLYWLAPATSGSDAPATSGSDTGILQLIDRAAVSRQASMLMFVGRPDIDEEWKETKGSLKMKVDNILAGVLPDRFVLTRLILRQAQVCVLRPGLGPVSPSLLSCLLGLLPLLLGGGLKLQLPATW